MTDDWTASRAEFLLARAAHARAVSGMLRADAAALARTMAETEEALARTLARLAREMPVHERRLRAMSHAAASQAAKELRWAREQGVQAAGADQEDADFALRQRA